MMIPSKLFGSKTMMDGLMMAMEVLPISMLVLGAANRPRTL
jgi:hypothetical protein